MWRVQQWHLPVSPCPDSLNSPPPFEPVPSDQQMNLSHIQSRYFSNCCVFFFAGPWNEQNLMWALSKKVFSVLWDQPDWFSKPDIPGAHLSSNDPRGQGTSCRAPTPCFSSRSTCLVRSLPCVPFFHITLLPHWGWEFFCKTVSASPTLLNMISLAFVGEQRSLTFQIFFRGKWPKCSCRCGRSSRTFYIAIFGASSQKINISKMRFAHIKYLKIAMHMVKSEVLETDSRFSILFHWFMCLSTTSTILSWLCSYVKSLNISKTNLSNLFFFSKMFWQF